MPQQSAVLTAASQPLSGFASQSPNPTAHVGTHTPFVQAVVPFALEQAWPQQSATVALPSRPSSGFRLQS
jgi:hypothetical protein